MFGLPAWAIIAIVAIVGGLFLGYKEKELKLEEKAILGNKQAIELKKMIQQLSQRLEKLERLSGFNQPQSTSAAEEDNQDWENEGGNGRNRTKS